MSIPIASCQCNSRTACPLEGPYIACMHISVIMQFKKLPHVVHVALKSEWEVTREVEECKYGNGDEEGHTKRNF